MTQHEIIKCKKCTIVVAQCRCLGPHTERYIDECAACKTPNAISAPVTTQHSEVEELVQGDDIQEKLEWLWLKYSDLRDNDLPRLRKLFKDFRDALTTRGAKEREKAEQPLAELVSALHNEFVFSGLATEQQWNDGVAPHLKRMGNVLRGLEPDSPTARVYKYPHKSVWPTPQIEVIDVLDQCPNHYVAGHNVGYNRHSCTAEPDNKEGTDQNAAEPHYERRDEGPVYPSHKELDMEKYRRLVAEGNFDALFNYGFDVGRAQHRREVEEARTITEDTSDGYHTFRELYEFRLLYNAHLFNEWAAQGKYDVHKSQRHNDGELCFGRDDYFVVVATLPTGQISNHYPMCDWHLFDCEAVERAKAAWDGHTSQDVAGRLRKALPRSVEQTGTARISSV